MVTIDFYHSLGRKEAVWLRLLIKVWSLGWEGQKALLRAISKMIPSWRSILVLQYSTLEPSPVDPQRVWIDSLVVTKSALKNHNVVLHLIGYARVLGRIIDLWSQESWKMKEPLNSWPPWDLKEENKPKSEKNPESTDRWRRPLYHLLGLLSLGLITSAPFSVISVPSHALHAPLSS